MGDASKRLLPRDAYFYYVNAVYMDLFSADADGGAHTPLLWVSAVLTTTISCGTRCTA